MSALPVSSEWTQTFSKEIPDSMELSITGVATRQSRKATIRIGQKLSPMKDSFGELPITEKSHNCIIVTLIGEPLDHFRVVPNPDGIYQVEVGYGDNLSFSLPPDAVSDHKLLDASLDSCWKVIRSYSEFTDSDLGMITAWFDDWRIRLA